MVEKLPKQEPLIVDDLDDPKDVLDEPVNFEDDKIEEDNEEIFNPQEIDYGEVERLRNKVGTLESLLSESAQKEPALILKAYIESQEAIRKENAEANQQLMQVVQNLQQENRELKDKVLEL